VVAVAALANVTATRRPEAALLRFDGDGVIAVIALDDGRYPRS